MASALGFAARPAFFFSRSAATCALPSPSGSPLRVYSFGSFLRELKRYNVGEDCPVFDGLYDYCRTYTGGSMGGMAIGG